MSYLLDVWWKLEADSTILAPCLLLTLRLQVFSVLCHFLDHHATEPYRLSAWSPAALAAAAAGLTKLMPQEHPGLLLQHYATRLIDSNMLQSAPTCSLVLIAAAAGEWAETAGSCNVAAAAAVDPAAAAAGGVPADLMDALAREFDVRMSLQLAECKCWGCFTYRVSCIVYRLLLVHVCVFKLSTTVGCLL
jgi:hypothetical protein